MIHFLILRQLDFQVDPELAYPLIAGDAPYAYWLDSARPASPMSRFSYVGVVPEGAEVIRIQEVDAEPEKNIWQVLPQELSKAPAVEVPTELEGFLVDQLLGGYVGYFGYEARRALGFTTPFTAQTPDALWMPALRYLMVEQQTGKSFLVGDREWVDSLEAHLATLSGLEAEEGHNVQGESFVGLLKDAGTIDFPDPSKGRYLQEISDSLHEIYEGNSYEVCLTAETRTQLPEDLNSPQGIFNLYRAQRRHNSAPFAAFFRCADHWVLSSSPERFLSVSAQGMVETKPIKGTVERAANPLEDIQRADWLRTDEKTRAENLMIVDLLRNDLSRVSAPGSVHVPVLMGVESYSTVHQLVSTIAAQLRSDVGPVGAVAACFPGGSMTGAPKPSTMEIIDRLEGRARGIYSGALGFFSRTVAANLSIVIRTLVVLPGGEVSLSAGGAIVADSDPEAEYEEMLAKLRAATPGQATASAAGN